MSYILSALKKVERDRQTGTAPSLLSVQIEEATPIVGTRWSQILTVAVGFMVLLAVGVWYLPNWVVGTDWNQILKDNPLVERTAIQHPLPIQSAPSPATEASTSLVIRPFAEADDSNQIDRPVALRQDKTVDPYLLPNHGFDRIPAFNEIAPEVRNQIPPFSVSGYLYSSQRPQASKAIVNGTALRAGQYISDDLMIKEINADYIVMDFRGMFFRIEHGEFSKN